MNPFFLPGHGCYGWQAYKQTPWGWLAGDQCSSKVSLLYDDQVYQDTITEEDTSWH
jgi:hypothetical protein